MSYVQFLRGLFESGHLIVPELSTLSDEELLMGDRVLAEHEGYRQLDLPGAPPQFDAKAARWAAIRFFRAGQFAVFRNHDITAISRELDVPIDCQPSAAIHYSVDLVFRFLADLAKFTCSAAENDPLQGYLDRWASEWPLSSVGMLNVENASSHVLREDSTLDRLYVDRIIATGDMIRLTCPFVRQSVKNALGMHQNLVPQIVSDLNKYDDKDVDP